MKNLLRRLYNIAESLCDKEFRIEIEEALKSADVVEDRLVNAEVTEEDAEWMNAPMGKQSEDAEYSGVDISATEVTALPWTRRAVGGDYSTVIAANGFVLIHAMKHADAQLIVAAVNAYQFGAVAAPPDETPDEEPRCLLCNTPLVPVCPVCLAEEEDALEKGTAEHELFLLYNTINEWIDDRGFIQRADYRTETLTTVDSIKKRLAIVGKFWTEMESTEIELRERLDWLFFHNARVESNNGELFYVYWDDCEACDIASDLAVQQAIEYEGEDATDAPESVAYVHVECPECTQRDDLIAKMRKAIYRVALMAYDDTAVKTELRRIAAMQMEEPFTITSEDAPTDVPQPDPDYFEQTQDAPESSDAPHTLIYNNTTQMWQCETCEKRMVDMDKSEAICFNEDGDFEEDAPTAPCVNTECQCYDTDEESNCSGEDENGSSLTDCPDFILAPIVCPTCSGTNGLYSDECEQRKLDELTDELLDIAEEDSVKEMAQMYKDGMLSPEDAPILDHEAHDYTLTHDAPMRIPFLLIKGDGIRDGVVNDHADHIQRLDGDIRFIRDQMAYDSKVTQLQQQIKQLQIDPETGRPCEMEERLQTQIDLLNERKEEADARMKHHANSSIAHPDMQRQLDDLDPEMESDYKQIQEQIQSLSNQAANQQITIETYQQRLDNHRTALDESCDERVGLAETSKKCIIALEREVAKYQSLWESVGQDLVDSEVKRMELEAENERLREGLQEIAQWNQDWQDDSEICARQWRGCVAIARGLLDITDK